MNHIIQYFYLDKFNSDYGVNEKNYNKRNEYYFRCIVNFFYSCFENLKGDKVDYYFVCNEIDEIEFIPNFNFKKFLLDNGIKIIKKNAEYVKSQLKWSGAMYLFDAIEAIIQNKNYLISDNDNFLFFDNDILINSSLRDIHVIFEDWDILIYDRSHEYIKNGKWSVDYNGIDKVYMNDSEFKPYGGEFIGLKGKKIIDFYNIFKNIYPIDGLKTEEHYISYILTYLLNNDYKISFINPYIKRIWTTYKYSNKKRDDYKINILHLPSEKEFGLFYLNKYLCETNKYDKNVALQYVGIYKRWLNLTILICLRKIVKKLRYLLMR